MLYAVSTLNLESQSGRDLHFYEDLVEQIAQPFIAHVKGFLLNSAACTGR